MYFTNADYQNNPHSSVNVCGRFAPPSTLSPQHPSAVSLSPKPHYPPPLTTPAATRSQVRSSRANLAAAIIEAQIASVELKRSLVRSSSSLAFARLISPIQTAPASSSVGKTIDQRRFQRANTSGVPRTRDSLAGSVSTGAAMFSRQPCSKSRNCGRMIEDRNIQPL